MPGEPSDAELARRVGATVAQPRVRRPDSFVLHSPLELIARVALLPLVSPERRSVARDRIAAVADGVAAFGKAVDPPAAISFASPQDAAARLALAIERGELDDADAAAAWLGDHVLVEDLAGLLGDAVVTNLAAAGHAPIFFASAPLVAHLGGFTGPLLRPLVRALALDPGRRLEWVEHLAVPAAPSSPGAGADGAQASGVLLAALAAVPSRGRPSQDFIHPLMKRVDDGSTAALLGPAVLASAGDLPAARAAVLRAAAWSMLREPGPQAPYLWSHCLTMPLAVLMAAGGSGQPALHLAVAATYVAGFRSAYATNPLEGDLVEESDLPVGEALAAGQAAAAAAAWAVPEPERPALVQALVDHALVHEDAHLVKYTLACLLAARLDPPAARTYLAAAASLGAWWAQNG